MHDKPMQGEVSRVSGSRACETSGIVVDGEVMWSWHSLPETLKTAA
ncbi:MAG: hypothetical protein ACXWLD_10315 [Rhizomicrobium sp.]